MGSDEGEPVVQASVEVAASYSGPLPPPEWLRQYEAVLPGVADRMMTVVESEVANQHAGAEHCRNMERTLAGAGITLATRGQTGAQLLALAFLVAAVVLILSGHSVLGGVMGLADLVGIVASFTVALLRRRDDRHAHD